MSREHPRALVTGYIGYQNTGDELLLRSIVHGVERHRLPLTIDTLSRDPELTRRIHSIGSPDHPAFGGAVRPSVSTRWCRARATMRCDILLLGPGGLLQDYDQRGLRNIFSVWRMAALARLGGARVVGIGLGAGPIVTQWGKRITRSIGWMSDLLLVRDETSIALMRDLGVPSSRMRLVADLALSTDWDVPRRTAGARRVLGVSIFNFYEYIHGNADTAASLRAVLAEALDRIAEDGVAIRFISMQGPFGGHDEQEARAVVERMHRRDSAEVLPYLEDPEATLAEIARCDWFVGMRLHSLIMALIASVPVAALSYHPKVTSFMHDIGLDGECVSIDELTVASLAPVLARLVATDVLAEETVQRRKALAKQAERNFVELGDYVTNRFGLFTSA